MWIAWDDRRDEKDARAVYLARADGGGRLGRAERIHSEGGAAAPQLALSPAGGVLTWWAGEGVRLRLIEEVGWIRTDARRVWPVLAVLLLGACEDAAERLRPVAVGNPAPAYAAANMEGDSVRLADLRGEVVLLNIWATWCPPCREEMPDLEELHRTYEADGLRVIGATIDSRSAAAEVRRFVAEHDITFGILHDPDERVTRTFRTAGVPETFLIDRDGVIAQRWIGKIEASSPTVQGPIRQALGLEAGD